MIRPDPHFFDDIAKVAGGAMNVMSGLRQQMRDDIKARVEEMAARLDLVPREDLERVEALLASAIKRIEALEGKKPAAKPQATPKSKTTTKAKKKK